MSLVDHPPSRPVVRAVPLGLFALAGASIGTMALGNLLELRTATAPLVFVLCAVTAAGLYFAARVPLPDLNRREHLVAIGLAAVTALIRLPYLFEPLIGWSLEAACWDDWWHVQEVASLVHSAAFPLRSSFDPDAYFTFYYAPWMPGAALFLSGALQTAKQALFVDIALLQLMAGYAVVYTARVLWPDDHARRWTFVCAAVLFGGFDAVVGAGTMAVNWATGASHAIPHAEWWPTHLGFELQHSGFITLALWVPHHLAGAIACGFALFLLSRELTLARAAVAGVTLAYAAFASVFAVIGAIPVLAWAAWRARRAWPRLVACALVALVVAAPNLWMYLQADGGRFEWFGAVQDYWAGHRVLGIPVFLGILGLEFCPLIVAVWLTRRSPEGSRAPLVCGAAFLLSTFVVAFAGANNYATRGAIVPIATLLVSATPGLLQLVRGSDRRRWLLVPFFLGGLWELASFGNAAVHAFVQSTPVHVQVLQSNMRRDAGPPPALEQAAATLPQGWYLLEHLRSTPKAPLRESDAELLSRHDRYRLTWRGFTSTR